MKKVERFTFYKLFCRLDEKNNQYISNVFHRLPYCILVFTNTS
ncbi:hypothetical protein LEP1GSC008_2361 [Leptospira kirschneri serovar Bulgarica str. Nikolaevo]|uniref:Uncharacterized protein n=1 Tax=Leptospira kirschneri serovar Bulgarica str. Nikolaevo TaxID=1240687 RepID=M6FAL4_9LEPT|nr:hypothetical protein LEP1GSC008_2361 [Leptospira kirschneri serovar Bulgarica str. Nikolaevo]